MNSIIEFLQKNTKIQIQCPKCEASMTGRRANLFDIRLPYPSKIKGIMSRLLNKHSKSLKGLEVKIKKGDLMVKALNLNKTKVKLNIKQKPKRVKTTTESVNIGQIVEKIMPLNKSFPHNHLDCRALFDPIDYIAFDGLNKGKVDSITFIEIKSGDARLGKYQRQIKSVIENGDVKVLEF